MPTVAPTSGHIDHPTGATDIVLRYEQGGGFVPIGFLFTQAPTFTLYGDGTVVFQARYEVPLTPGHAPPPWRVGRLSEDGVQALLAFALRTAACARRASNTTT